MSAPLPQDQQVTNTAPSRGVNFCEAAARQVLTLMLEEERLDLSLRVYITGGGCSGFQYGFAFEDHAEDDDHVVTTTVLTNTLNKAQQTTVHALNNSASKQAVPLLVDPVSLQYLEGAEIDYRHNIEGAHFVIRNPNAKTTCGCGSSFSTE